MPGALLQLAAYGAENHPLNGNPSMTFFRALYRRYTHFAMEAVRLPIKGPTELAPQSSIQLKCHIERHGDLLSQLYLSIDLPHIFSGYNPITAEAADPAKAKKAAHQFQWIRCIGANLVRKVELHIGPTVVNTLYGEYLQIWQELFSPFDREVFNDMVGNVPELYDPASVPANHGIYPTSTLQPELDQDPLNFSTSAYLQNPYNRPPSIRGRTLIIPLSFYFGAGNPGLSVPLLCLQRHEVYCHLELRPLNDLYTIIETDMSSPLFGKRVPPTTPQHALVNFLSNDNPHAELDSDLRREGAKVVAPVQRGWYLNAHLDANFCFLDSHERTKFAAASQEYIIESVQRHEFLGVHGEQSLELRLQHPVKALVWVAVKDTHPLENNYSNYTNWYDPLVPPGSLESLRRHHHDEITIDPNTGDVIDNIAALAANNTIATKFNFRYHARDIIEHATLLFDGIERFERRDHSFFTDMQFYQHRIHRHGGRVRGDGSTTCASTSAPPLHGVMLYSFALDPSKSQPTGACNMSRINKVQLRVKTTPAPTLNDNRNGPDTLQHRYNIYVYSISYNVLRVLAGMGGLSFQS